MRPGSGLFAAAAFLFALGIAAFFHGFAEFIFLSFSGLVLLLALIDFVLCIAFTKAPSAERHIPEILALGKESPITLTLSREKRRFIPPRLRIFDIWPDSFRCDAYPRLIHRKDWNNELSIDISCTITPIERGPWEYHHVDILQSSPLGFWRKHSRLAVPSKGKTWPDFKSLVRQAEKELRGKTQETGIKEVRRRGEGTEFHSLRDYVPGDQVRAIDWRATARRGKPVVREFRNEEDQRILILLDAGYRLHPQDGELRLFDRALNAAMYLARVALKQGDSVSVQSFGNGQRGTPFRKGLAALNSIMETLHDQKSAPGASSPAHALEEAAKKLSRRTLIILVSRLREEDADTLVPLLPRITRRHLLLCVNIADEQEQRVENSNARDDESLLAQAAAHRDRSQREAMYHRFQRAGLLVMETSSASLAPAMTSRYLQLKNSGKL